MPRTGVAAALAVVALALLVATSASLSASSERGSGRRTLVLLDEVEGQNNYRRFFSSLRSAGHELRVAAAGDGDIELVHYGETLYDNVILFAPAADTWGNFDVEGLVQFVDNGGNVLMAVDSDASDASRRFAREMGMELEPAGTFAIDHFHVAPGDDGDHTLIVADDFIDAAIIWGDDARDPVVYRGTGMVLNSENELLLPLLRASKTAFSHKPLSAVKQQPTAVGATLVLAGALQARNNARVTVVGSLSVFADESADLPVGDGKANGNADFAEDLAAWTFRERGVIRGSNVRHNKVGGTALPEYRVNDDIEYHVTLEEWAGGQWRPYTGTDVQLEFTMLDPRIRTTLAHDGRGHYSARFTTPDVYGVYQFKITYNRVGYTYVRLADTVTVRPFRHNEYERFIAGAFPYYAGAFAVMGCFAMFSFLFLAHRDSPKHE